MFTFSLNEDVHKLSKGSLFFKRPISALGKEWWSDAIIRSVDDKKEQSDTFNVDAYGVVCEWHLNARLRKNVRLVDSKEQEEWSSGGLVAEAVVAYLDVNLDSLFETSEVATLVNSFLEWQDLFEIEEGVNLWKLFKKVISGDKSVLDVFRGYIERYNLEELIKSIISNTGCIPALEEVFS